MIAMLKERTILAHIQNGAALKQNVEQARVASRGNVCDASSTPQLLPLVHVIPDKDVRKLVLPKWRVHTVWHVSHIHTLTLLLI